MIETAQPVNKEANGLILIDLTSKLIQFSPIVVYGV